MHRAQQSRVGYALVWVILTIAIIAAPIATAAPTLATLNERSRAASTAVMLRALSTGFTQFGVLVGAYPGNVSELTNTLTTSNKNTCRGAMTGSNVGNWPANAPYVPFYVPTSGLWTELGRVRDSVPARPSSPGSAAIFVELPGVSGADAVMLDLLIDNGTGDTVTYAAPVNDTTTIRYRMVSSSAVSNNRC